MILKTTSLPQAVLDVIYHKGTEKPFSGDYHKTNELGTYLCRQCGLALFRAESKFESSCGWPSFDEEIAQAVLLQADMDGHRTEIVCARCLAHLGHVFKGEGFTAKNSRHCVNSVSIDFVADTHVTDTEEAIFAAGCFWGVEYYFQQLPGVLKTEVGYTGGTTNYPTYETVCSGHTGHYEAVRVIYDPIKINYDNLVKYFFEIHDPIQRDGQGPDVGSQYLSCIFYYTSMQQQTSLLLIQQLENKGYTIATQVLPAAIFWRAEEYHQHYYQQQKKYPYCHRDEKKF